MADGRRFWPYLSSGLSNFHKMLCDDAKYNNNHGRVL